MVIYNINVPDGASHASFRSHHFRQSRELLPAVVDLQGEVFSRDVGRNDIHNKIISVGLAGFLGQKPYKIRQESKCRQLLAEWVICTIENRQKYANTDLQIGTRVLIIKA